MKKKKFKVEDWLPESNRFDSKNEVRQESPLQGGKTRSVRGVNQEITSDLENIISQIETNKIDLTSTYADWRDIGFAFADALGEDGRSFFHRISQFYPDYSKAECDSQFDKCLKSGGSGVTMKSFFHFAKSAGVDISPSTRNSNLEPRTSQHATCNSQPDPLPTIPETVYDYLPDFLKKVVTAVSTSHEKDLLLLGSLVTLSSCINKVYGIYDNKKVYSNLYLFVIAIASAGKAILTHCKQLVNPIHKQLREEAQALKEEYTRDLNEYNANKKKHPDAQKPEKPPVKLLFIPANSSSTGAFQLLHDNDGKGLIFETEGDTLSNTFKTDYGNYSDGFRKAFHHETISYFRRTDNEHVEIDFPRLSTLLSGTPNQVMNLIPDAENGLFSRFMFYYLDIKPEWKNVFARFSENGHDEYFGDLGDHFYEFYKQLATDLEIEFFLTADQQQQFNDRFSEWQDFYRQLLGIDYLATVRRLGLITFRLAMIFSTLRLIDTGELPLKIICEEVDFQNAVAITEVLIQHAAKVFSELPAAAKPVKRKNLLERFYEALPDKFSRQEYLKVASSLNIKEKTAESYIAKLKGQNKLHHDKKDLYEKLHS